MKARDLTGLTFGNLTVLRPMGKSKSGKQLSECRCSCGEVLVVQNGNLNSGNSKSCKKCSKIEDLTGRKFNKLTVIRYSHTKDKKSFWYCNCDCGNENVLVRSDGLKDGNNKSCGCLLQDYHERRAENAQTFEKLYHVWAGMKDRCNNPNTRKYYDYGGRGIKICDEWNGSNSYKEFKVWAISNGYSEGLSIDRIDVNGNYEPSNCRWVTQKVQTENTRSNKYYTYNGKTLLLRDWSKELGIKQETLYSRINSLGWSVEKAFETPVLNSNKLNVKRLSKAINP